MSGAEQAVQIFGSVISISALIIVVWELALNVLGKRGYYRFADVGSNLYTFFLYGLIGSAAFGGILVCYRFVQGHLGLFDIRPDNTWAWLGGFVLTDFCHYWFHRTAHRNNFMWGIHQGHHTSEDFNLSTALRKGIFQQCVDWPFFLPMAVMGYPFFTMYLPLKSLQFAYQFWLHNQFVGKLGPVEKLMVTPSLHRVHHACNPEYIDRNYAGVFIIWDKLFGSYAEEQAPVRYGVTTPVKSFNPVGYQFTWWKNLWRDATATKSWWDAVRVWFMPVGWRPRDRRDVPWADKQPFDAPFVKFDLPTGLWSKGYAAVQLALVVMALQLLTGREFHPFSVAADALVLGYVVWTSVAVGAYLDQRPWAFRLDLVRNLVILAAWASAGYLQTFPAQALLPMVAGHAVGMVWQLGYPLFRAAPASAAVTAETS